MKLPIVDPDCGFGDGQANYQELVVSPDGSGHYPTIAATMAAAARVWLGLPLRITLQPGTYNESVAIPPVPVGRISIVGDQRAASGIFMPSSEIQKTGDVCTIIVAANAGLNSISTADYVCIYAPGSNSGRFPIVSASASGRISYLNPAGAAGSGIYGCGAIVEPNVTIAAPSGSADALLVPYGAVGGVGLLGVTVLTAGSGANALRVQSQAFLSHIHCRDTINGIIIARFGSAYAADNDTITVARCNSGLSAQLGASWHGSIVVGNSPTGVGLAQRFAGNVYARYSRFYHLATGTLVQNAGNADVSYSQAHFCTTGYSSSETSRLLAASTSAGNYGNQTNYNVTPPAVLAYT